MPNLHSLPTSEDIEFWGDSEHYRMTPVGIPLCSTHRKDNWQEHDGYKEEGQAILCTRCPWGTQIPGYMRVVEGKIVDLRV